MATLCVARRGAAAEDVCGSKPGDKSCEPPPPSTLLDECFAELLIAPEDVATLKSAGYTLVSDLEDANVDELIEDGVKRVVAKKLVRELKKVSFLYTRNSPVAYLMNWTLWLCVCA